MKILYAFLLGIALAERNPRQDRKVVTLVRDLEHRYYISCTTVLYNGRGISDRAVAIGKDMMTSFDGHGSVSVKSIRSYLEMFDLGEEQDKGCTRFFYLILADEDEDIQRDVKQVSRENRTPPDTRTFLPFSSSSLSP